MGAPAFFTISGGSVGAQVGGQSTDLVLLVMNDRGMNNLLKDKLTIGATASAAAGPVGRSAHAKTDARLGAGILSWSRSRGAFVGVSLDGAVINPDKKANKAFYGHTLNAREILLHGAAPVPQVAKSFVERTNQYARRTSRRAS